MLEDAVSNNFAKTCPLPKRGIILNLLSLEIDVRYKLPSVSRFCGITMLSLCTVGVVCDFLFSFHMTIFSNLNYGQATVGTKIPNMTDHVKSKDQVQTNFLFS